MFKITKSIIIILISFVLRYDAQKNLWIKLKTTLNFSSKKINKAQN